MKYQWRDRAALFVSTVLFAGSSLAAVSADEAKQLGGDTLTIWGAEKAGNKDGSIPAYTGTPIKVPASYDPKYPGQHPDPFGEKPLFTITAQSAAQYADRLTEGQKALFKAYPEYRMDIYPTHRTAIFPKYVLDNTLKNATVCKSFDDDARIEGCYAGLPFPIPKTAKEVMWNHLAGYETFAWKGEAANWVVPRNGPAVLQAISTVVQENPFYNPARATPNTGKDIIWRVRTNDTAPARRIGNKVLIVDALDQRNVGRRAWQYIPGQRRVKLAPDLSYDTPNPYTGGTSTMDDVKGFSGSMDRYDWKLLGKQEKYILFNNFATHDAKACPEAKLTATKNFPNPDCIRWELHRVWVVQATLKPGFRHIYAKRTLYWDEDGFMAGQGESYDAGGRLFRVVLPIHYTMYATQSGTVSGTFAMDLNTGMWSVNASCGFPGGGWSPVASPGDTYFSPEGMAGDGIR